ncbi:exonuclease domain-containing protein [Flavobacterium rivuli]|uniref:exonuclease domain-containing protein n=1 Tax=Flavobacterium rivuli TaxID=498301 RepID=UPI00035F3773|nr:exonuclease domain-containing protein [Flavobacterium rivuli]
MKNNFVALDFETSYGKIPCSIGLVEFVDGIPVRKYYKLIKPFELKFSYINSGIHGIKLEHVINEREFNLIWDDISHLINNRVIVCHNSSFDIAVLNHALELYNIPKPNYTSHCTYRISQQCLDLNNYKLSSVAKHFKFDQFNYHNALEDALICGKIFYELYDGYNLSAVSQESKKQSNSFYNQLLERSLNTKPIENAFVWNKSTILFNKSFVVSGIFKRFSRDGIISAIVENGGLVKTSISSKTHYVVAGGNMGPAKLEKANQLGIKIVSEDEFIKLISDLDS